MNRKKTDNGEWIDFFFVAPKWHGEPRIMEPDKCDEVGWFNLEALPENTIPFVREAIHNFKKGIAYSEFGFTS